MKARIDLGGPWSAIRRSPMLRMVSPFVAGLLAAHWFCPLPMQALVALGLMTPAVLLVLVFPTLPFSRWQRGLVLTLWFFSFGLFLQVVRLSDTDPHHVSHLHDLSGPWAFRVEAINGVTDRTIRVDGSILARSNTEGMVRVNGGVMLTLMHKGDSVFPHIGDRIWVDATLEAIDRVPEPGGFDRRKWAASRGIALEAFAPVDRWTLVDHGWHWTDPFVAMRERVSGWLNASGLPVRERALVKALVLGQRDELDSDQKDAFARSGTIHVLAVSGMHVGLIFAVLSFLFGWWGAGLRARWIRGVLLLLALWFYAGLTGGAPSVLRATVMFSLFTLAGIGRQRTDHLNSLFAAALVLLVWDPNMLLHAGFQLSFLAVLGIILFHGPLERLWMPVNPWLSRTWSLAMVSLSAQLLTAPLSLYLFKAFPMWFLPANVVVVSAIGLAVPGAVALILLFRVPLLGVALTWALTLLLKAVGWTTGFFAAMPGAYPSIRIDALDMTLMYLLVLAVGAWWQWGWNSMRWVIGIIALALLVAWGYRARSVLEQERFVVYEQRDGLLAGLVKGRELNVLASNDSLIADRWVTKKLDRHQRAAGIDLVRSSAMPQKDTLITLGGTFIAPGRWRSSRIDVLFVQQDAWPRRLDGPKADVAVVHDLRWIDADQVAELVSSSERIVIADGVKWKARKLLRKACDEAGIPCHVIREQGAFLLER